MNHLRITCWSCMPINFKPTGIIFRLNPFCILVFDLHAGQEYANTLLNLGKITTNAYLNGLLFWRGIINFNIWISGFDSFQLWFHGSHNCPSKPSKQAFSYKHEFIVWNFSRKQPYKEMCAQQVSWIRNLPISLSSGSGPRKWRGEKLRLAFQ